MPDLGIGETIGILSLILGGAGVAEGIHSQLSQPSAPTAAQLANAQQQANRLSPAQLASAVNSAKGNTQAATSGGVSPDYLSQLVQSQYGSAAGNPGVVGQQASQQWGGGGGTSFGTATSGGNTSFGGATLPFGNASSSGLSNTGLASPQAPGGFNISEWLQQMQQQGA